MTAARFPRAVADLPEGDYEVALHSGEEDDVTRARYHNGDTRGGTSPRPWNPARSRRRSPPAASRRSASGSSSDGPDTGRGEPAGMRNKIAIVREGPIGPVEERRRSGATESR